MKRLFLIVAVSFLVFNSYSPAVQLDSTKYKIEKKHVAGAVSVIEMSTQRNHKGELTYYFINLAVSSGHDGILLVDTGPEPFVDKIKAVLNELGDGKLKYVINTHWHQNHHTGGNRFFRPEALIIAHTYTRNKLLTGHRYSNGRIIPPVPKEALPVLTFDDSLSIHFNGEEVKLLHVRYCHTQGDIIAYFTKSKVIHLGQFIDTQIFPSLNVNDGGDVEKYAGEMANLIRLLPDDVKLISSHGPTSTLEYLKNYHRMVVETTDIVRQKIEDGKTLDEIESEDLPDKYRSWDTGWATTKHWISRVYNSLMKKNKDK